MDEPSEVLLSVLFDRAPTNGWVEITYKAPEDSRLFPHIVVDWYPAPTVALFGLNTQRIATMNHQGYSVYCGFGVRRAKRPPEQRVTRTGQPYLTYRRGRQEDITHIPALWVDIDVNRQRGVLSVDDAIQQATQVNPPPSIIIHTGGGVHALWLLDTPVPMVNAGARQYVTWVLRGLAMTTHGDLNSAEISRMVRLPGTVNTKPERQGAVCQIVSMTDLRYPLRAFLPFAKMAESHFQPDTFTPTRPFPIPPSGSLPKLRKLDAYLTGGAADKTRNKTLFWAARRLHDANVPLSEAEQLLGARASADGLKPNEIRATIRSAYKYAPDRTGTVERADLRQLAAHDAALRGRERWSQRHSKKH